jgi:tRNA_anti-like
MGRRKLLGYSLLGLLAIGAAFAYFMYNQPHRSAAKEKGLAVAAMQLCADYEANEEIADKKYIGKLLEVSGTITELTANQKNNSVVMLAGSNLSGVQCSLLTNESGLKSGDTVTIKGFCTGYLLPDVKLDRCVVKN